MTLQVFFSEGGRTCFKEPLSDVKSPDTRNFEVIVVLGVVVHFLSDWN